MCFVFMIVTFFFCAVFGFVIEAWVSGAVGSRLGRMDHADVTSLRRFMLLGMGAGMAELV